MPQRTASKRAPGRSRAAAELPRCRTSGSSPSASAIASASRNLASWRSLAGWSGSSLQAKCDQTPVTRQLPASSPARARRKTSAQLEAGAPPRESPVSTLICRRAGMPVAATAAAISSSSATEYAVTSTSRASAWAYSSPGTASQHSSRPSSPASRRATASSSVATPIHSAPASRAARADSSIPWP